MISLTWIGYPVIAMAAWWLGRFYMGFKQPTVVKDIHREYFKGLNYLINEQPDKAVDIFIHLLEVDSDTVETHFALGHLFRRRGEVDRAIRIHQNLIARPDLPRGHKVQALSALGQDYLSAGVLDRAERLFLELKELKVIDETSMRFLLRIYEQEKDWDKAIQSAREIAALTRHNMDVEVAHYYCELAEQARLENQLQEAITF